MSSIWSSHPELFLSNDYIISFSKDILKPYHCEWGSCSETLNSWSTYEKHVGRHCRRIMKAKGVPRKCEWRSCLSRALPSLQDLLKHVELSHLSRVSLRCPIKDCSEAFSRHDLLPDHFFGTHHAFPRGCAASELISNARRTTRLSIPQWQALPRLPKEPVPCALLNEVCASIRQKPLTMLNGPSQSQNIVSHGRKYRRGRLEDKRNTRQGAPKKDEHEDEESEGEYRTKVADVNQEPSAVAQLKSKPQFILRHRTEKTWASIEKELGGPPVARLDGETPPRAPPMSFGFEKLFADPEVQAEMSRDDL